MTTQEGLGALGLGTAARHDRAYFLDLLGDSHAGLGRYEAAIEAYREAAQGFEADGAPCSRALCLFKVADSYMSLHEPWHALGYLEVCLPLLRELGLVRGSCSPSRRTRRLAVPAGGKSGRIRGYGNAAERHDKAVRLRSLQARLARVERQLEAGTVSVVRGGKALLRARNNLTAARLTENQWRERWDSARLFLTADGEAAKALGNETIRWHPGEGWLEIKLPAPLAQLANRPHGRYRLSCLVGFSYRGDEVAAQVTSGAVRYDITHDPARGRWYLDASWKRATAPVPSLAELRAARWSLSTSTTVISPRPSPRRTATSWAPRPPSPSAWPGCRRPPATGTCAPPSPP